MRPCLILSAVLLLASPGQAQQHKPPPPGKPPQLWQASASQQGGKIVVQIARPQYETPRKAVVAEAMKWDNLRPVTLDKNVRAFDVDGRPLKPQSVLMTLSEPRGVAVFVRSYVKDHKTDLDRPDPHYLALLRRGTVVLVVADTDVYPLLP